MTAARSTVFSRHCLTNTHPHHLTFQPGAQVVPWSCLRFLAKLRHHSSELSLAEAARTFVIVNTQYHRDSKGREVTYLFMLRTSMG